ncbi:glycosyltransferase family 2 protein [Flavobacterium davisii]|uniref:glycosyltransferase family 2 protein n=1 Tax=Flavobacterium davisii TaxID=2906077 RepID=UPI0035D050BD
MNISFICVNYDSHEETKKYIKNVFELSDYSFTIVVDNSPTNESCSILESFLKEENFLSRAKILKRENRGYFQGLNDGLEVINKSDSLNSFVVVGNNDIIFESNFIDQLSKLKIEEDILIIAPDVITRDGIHENPHVINKMSFLRKLKYEIYFSNYYIAKLITLFYSAERKAKPFDPEAKSIYMGIGALYILTPNFFKYFDKLREDVFLYGEEAVLADQINSVGGKIWYEPSLKCYHNESSTTSKMDSKYKYNIIQKSYKIYKKYL